MGGDFVSQPIIAILSGGISGEREVSVRSARAVCEALRPRFETALIDVNSPSIPDRLDPERHVIFSALHGVFGEDGGMQALLDSAGFSYAGSDAASSRLCMDKSGTKAAAASVGVRVPAGLEFSAESPLDVDRVLREVGDDVVVKPNNEGSSLGLCFARGEPAIRASLTAITPGRWMVEQRVAGRELTVGVLHGRAMGIVEILPRSGRFDYTSKYTKGLTDYRYPADLPEEVSAGVRAAAEGVFLVCGCRDFARVDFMLSENGEAFFLEINTLPGLTETSLLPKSASCEGIDFPALACELVGPAVERFHLLPKRTLT